ncbi:hypothetical protein KVT40_004215 [Elsinoe batatas]|uniref:Uncharacterized protein n=1 Tax=Elsinoe batatas TaxID=2601811 RepID=A0A8K0L3B0_9PEZI|nr:hypothetical protein KVT40_004215 [Elsinoe batatas]
MSDAAHHMTDNYNKQAERETMIVTTNNQLYSVTYDRYYYYTAPAGASLILWSSDTSVSSRNWVQETRSDGKTQVRMGDSRTPGAYYQLCISEAVRGDRGTTGNLFSYYSADATLPSYCKLTTLVFESA